jgi:hypothetical protein
MGRIFIGSEALESGALTRYELRTDYRRILPDIYGPRRDELTLHDRTTAAWLWSKRDGIVSGLAASAMHGAKWVDVDSPIELNWANHKPPSGVITRNETLLDDEIARADGIAMTTAERTAFDLARRGRIGQAVARLDALARATDFKAEDVKSLASRHPHVKGLRRVDRVLDLVDAGAESPKESWLRLLLMDEGFPRPQTQIPVPGPDGHPLYYLDMGWDDAMIAVEYDGDDHRERPRWGNDIVRSEYVAHVGWTLIRVVAGNRRPEIVLRVNRAWALRWR